MLSFNEQTEFNLLPGPKIKRLPHHKYQINDFEALKLSAIYGANGAGKSNLLYALDFLIDYVTENKEDNEVTFEKFKLNENNKNKSQHLGVEFIHNGIPFIYGLEINDYTVISEELYYSGLGKNNDKLIFERTTSKEGDIKVNFPESFENHEKGKTLKNIIEENLSKPEKTTLKLLNELKIELLPEISEAYSWFENGIEVLLPDSQPNPFTKRIITDENFKIFANQMINAFDTGVKSFDTESKTIKEILGEETVESKEIDNLIQQVRNDPNKKISIYGPDDEEDFVLENKNGEVYLTRLILKHHNNNREFSFYKDEESDGTKRLIDYIPYFMGVINENKTYVIDEIEKSIHPLIVKTLISRFSEMEETKGQLIFTTHESNLLDQQIFRSDEIWFVEKNDKGESELYPLSDFKEHHTIDIGKGYLNGRYGAIPFLGNLKDLNWL